MRQRIAALIPDLVNSYHRSTFTGIAACAEKHDIDLVTLICGGYKRQDYYHYMRNVIFKMVDPESFDGFLLPLSSISQYVPLQELKDFIAPILSRPCVMLAAPVEGFSSVTPDYTDVIEKLALHLFQHHKIENLIFIRGPENHIASILKEQALRNLLTRLGISDDHLIILSNGFNPGTAAALVEKCRQLGLIKPRNALMFAGEEIALRTLTELKILGFSVPRDVIVCGTSESLNSRRTAPSITTVDCQFEKIGFQSVEMLLGLIKGDTPGKELTVESKLVLRGSCGCMSMEDEDSFTPERILKTASEIEKHEVPDDLYNDDLYNRVNGIFPGEKNKFFYSALDMSLHGHRKYIESHADAELYDHLFHFRRIGNCLASDLNFSELFGKGDDHFAVKRCFLSEYADGTPESGKLKMVQGYQGKNKVPIDGENSLFDSKYFYPAEYSPKERSLLIVEPVFHKQAQLGIMVIEYEKPDMSVHEYLRVQICNAMKNRKQNQEISESKKRFYDMAQTSSDWLWEIDSIGILVFSSGGIHSVPGFDPSEMIGKSFFECIQTVLPGEEDFLKKMILAARAPIYRIEVESRSSNGERVVFELSGKPLFDSKGCFTGYRGGCRDITDSKIAGEKMSQLLSEKETLIRELYHRTKNNMQVISSFMSLQSSATENTSVRMVFKEMQNRILAMSLVHQKLYQSKDLSHINLSEYIKDLSVHLVDGYRTEDSLIRLEYESMQDILVLIDTAIPCGMILNELITNSLKHAFPDLRQGKIMIGLSRTDKNMIVLKVADDGIGVAADFDFREKSGMGLKVAFALAEKQLNAEIVIDQTKGILFEIRFLETYYSERI